MARGGLSGARADTEASRKKKSSLLERLGIKYFARRAEAMPPVELVDPVHVLNPDERRTLRRLQRGAITRAFLVGAFAGGLVALAMSALSGYKGETWDDQIVYWTMVGIVGVITAVGEVAFMYWDSLRTIHKLAHAVGLDTFLVEDDRASELERDAVAAALARAALELPNPPDKMFGVDPRRELSRLRLIVVTVFYKAKISLTNFIIKAAVRRMLGRAGARAWLHYVGVPVTALWNSTVSWTVMRQARIRVMGPSAALEYSAAILDNEPPLSEAGQLVALQAVGCTIVSAKDMHPNLRALLSHLHKRFDEPASERLDDRATFLLELGPLPPNEQRIALRFLCVAVIIDGRITWAERRLVRTALAACGYDESTQILNQLRRQFLRGDSNQTELLQDIGVATPDEQ